MDEKMKNNESLEQFIQIASQDLELSELSDVELETVAGGCVWIGDRSERNWDCGEPWRGDV